jgi:hypothetical protein
MLARAPGDGAAPAAPAGPAPAPAPAVSLTLVPRQAPLDPDQWGHTRPEGVDIAFDAVKQGAAWIPQPTSIVGRYSMETRLMPGQQPITEANTTAENHCAQLEGLRALGKDLTKPNFATDWFVIEAVVAHEKVHEAHFEPSLKMSVNEIVRGFAQVSVPDDGAMDAAAAKAALEALPAYEKALKDAKFTWEANLLGESLDDHYGPTEKAERAVVDPVIERIAALAAKSGWAACPAPAP